MKKSLIFFFIFCLVVVLLISGCGSSTETTTTSTAQTSTTTTTSTTSGGPQYGGTLRYLVSGSPGAPFGWPIDSDTNGIYVTNFVWAEPLIFYRITGEVDPLLAESWDFSNDNKSITFHLRDDVKFHDGTDFNADAVKFVLDSVIESGNSITLNWESIEVVDEYTVILNLIEFTNAIWSDLATKACQMISPATVQDNDVDYARAHPVGTGPFVFESFDRDESAVFTRNENYWQDGKPYVDKLEFMFIKESMTQLAYMEAGDGHLLVNQTGITLKDMKEKGFQIFATASGTDMCIPDSTDESSPFSDQRVREALDYGIDNVSIADTLGFGYMFPNNQIAPAVHAFHMSGLQERDYDVDKAKELLADAGYPNGFSTTISTQAYWSAGALAVQEDLKKIGIETEVEVLDSLKWWDLCQNGWDGLLYAGFSYGPNFANSFKALFQPYSDNSIETLMPEGMGDMITAALATSDYEEQKQLNQDIVKAMHDNATVVCVLSNAFGYVVAPNVRDGHFLEGDAWQYWNPVTIWLEQ